METTARLRYMRGSAQKVRLVADLIRGQKVERALDILRFTKKAAARDIAKLLLSAVANAESNEGFSDVEALYVKTITVDGGPMEKRVQPAPMGRAFRIQKRKSHVTIALADGK